MNEECEGMKDRMADHIFDGLSAHDREVLDEHVARCSKCAKHFETLRDERALVRGFAEKVNADMQNRKEAMAETIKRGDRAGTMSGRRAPALCPVTRFAAAAAALIAVGFVAGRLMPSRPVDIEQLRTALESSLKSSLEEGIHRSLLEQVNRDRESALQRHYVWLKDELARQSRHEMSALAEMTLTASQATTEQRLAELIRLIEAARTVDHWQIARALEQIESNRLQDRARFGQSLVSLASLRNEMMPEDRERN